MYEYRAELVRVIDGDSVWLQVDLGFRMTYRDSFRLLGVDTPELRAKDPEEKKRAYEAKNQLELLLRGGAGLVVTEYTPKLKIQTEKAGKYGRWLVRLLVEDEEGEEIDASQWLIDNGYGKKYGGGKRG